MLILPTSCRTMVETWVRSGYPNETCGLLVGGGPEAERRVERVVQARNLNTERARDRYELDPADFVAADLAAREEKLEIVGIWHSHPDSPARPSETDRRAAWEGYSYVIASVTPDGVADLRSWRLDGDAFREEEIES